MVETTFIYGLNDPETGECRYIGKADDPHKRLFGCGGHLKRCHKKHHCACWIKSLVNRGLRPLLEVLQEVPVLEWELWERAWISASRKIGMDLTNVTDGGDGTEGGEKHPSFGMRHSAEARAKISASLKGNKRTKGNKLSPSHRAKIGAALKGNKLSSEHCAKISAAKKGKKGKKHSPETRARLSAILKGHKRRLGQKHSLETRAKMSAAQQRRWV